MNIDDGTSVGDDLLHELTRSCTVHVMQGFALYLQPSDEEPRIS